MVQRHDTNLGSGSMNDTIIHSSLHYMISSLSRVPMPQTDIIKRPLNPSTSFLYARDHWTFN